MTETLRGAGLSGGPSGGPAADPPAGSPAAEPWVVRASFAQERVWFTSQLAAGVPLFRVVDRIRLPGAPEPAVVRDALAAVVARHETLRTSFRMDGGDLMQVIHPDVPVEMPLTDLADLRPPDRTERIGEIAAELARVDLPLDRAPLWRARLVRVEAATWWLMVAAHHIIVDAAAQLNLQAELTELCAAAAHGRPARLPDLPIQYADFAAWERDRLRGERLERLLGYWRERLAGLPAVHSLPTDRPRPARRGFAGDEVVRAVPDEVTAALPAVAGQASATPFMVLLAGFVALLRRLTGQDDIVIGLPVAGRDRAELRPLIAMLVNVVVLRVDASGDPAFAELLRRVRQAVLEAWEHQEVPFQKVVEAVAVRRDPAVPPLCQIAFNHLTGGTGTANGTAEDDLMLEVADGTVRLEFDTALFDPGTAARLLDRYLLLLAAALADPGTRLGALPIMDGAERDLVVTGWNATGGPAPAGTLDALVSARAGRTPHAVAVVDERTRLDYAGLDAAANRVAHALRSRGVGPESTVAVCAGRRVELVVALLGVLKAGAAYLPLDPDYPVERLAFMLTDSGARVLLAERDLLGGAVGAALEAAAPGCGVLAIDDPGVWASYPETPPDPAAVPDNAAYVIYTSGSTGRPKGVVNTHRGIVNRLAWMQEAFGLDSTDTVLHKTPTGFDVSVWELFWPLAIGARLVLARPGGHRDPRYLASVIAEHRVTTIHFVPSMLRAFLAAFPDAFPGAGPDAGPDACRSLRRVVCSGEELPPDVAEGCLALLPGAELHNLYGPTEAAVDVTAWACTPPALAGRSRIPIGAPVPGVSVYVLDADLRPVPVGVAGELHIGGVQVARGYHGRPGLTARRFVPDPFGPPGARLYATGDSARWCPDGVLEFLGRLDGQVKVRGVRIEPGEIEAALRDRPDVTDAAVIVHDAGRGTGDTDPRLVAYLAGTRAGTAAPDLGRPGMGEPDVGEPHVVEPDLVAARDALRRRLPEHMIPSALIAVPRLPLSPNGKLDRAALPPPRWGEPSTTAGAEPATGTERVVARVWCEVLGVASVGRDDDFFDLGGHSLLAIQVVTGLRREIEAARGRVGVMDVFQYPTVRELAALIDAGEADRPRPLLYELTPPVPAERRVRSFVCVPYGGGLAASFQPLADALPEGNSLYAIAVPGHDIGVEEDIVSFDELVERCVAEIADRVTGPLVLYGHCVGGALLAGIARRLALAGRPIEAVYAGGIFPFARPRGVLGRLVDWVEGRGADRGQENFLRSIGAELADLDPAQVERFVGSTREELATGSRMFARWDDEPPVMVGAPVISVVGNRDLLTEFYQERYREWGFLTDTTALVVLDEAGHYFVKHRAGELAEILTRTHPALAGGTARELTAPARGPDASWWLEQVHRSGPRAAPARTVRAPADPEPSMGRFLAVTVGQLVSMTGSALTQWAVPVWVYLETGSLLSFGMSGVIAYLPALLALPVAGAIADRFDRRAVMLAACAVAGGVEAVLALLVLTDRLALGQIYALVAVMGFAAVFQRIGYLAAIPQLTPKRFLGHANGIAHLAGGASMLFLPLIAAGLLAAVGLAGILVIDVVSYVFAIGVLVAVRFPALMGRRRREPFFAELAGGARLAWSTPGFRAMLVFFALINICLAAPLLLVPPLVLAFAGMVQVGQVAFAEALGAVIGGLLISVWGGPARGRMQAIIVTTLGVAACCVLTGLRPHLALVAAGVFGTGLGLAVNNGVYLTIIQLKVPQRFHGRVIAVIQTLTWSTFPIGFAILAPASGAVLEPLLAADGALAGTVGAVIGTGPGRGVGLAFVVFGLLLGLVAVLGLRVRRLRRLDAEIPDALPDDVVGLQMRTARHAGTAG